MYITTLALQNFRNYENETIVFDKGLNIVYGNNAQGKTNLLEAIYLCATSKSHRTNNDKELIHFNNYEAHIKLKITKDHRNDTIDVHLKKNSHKGIAVNQIPIKKMNELFGLLNVIMFSPEDLGIIKRGPSHRRKFIDLELCQLNPIYYYNLQNYYKVLKQRNHLLKNYKDDKSSQDLMEIWDEQLIKYGKSIILLRQTFIEQLNPLINKIHSDISLNREKLELIYECNTQLDNYHQVLKNNICQDIKFRSTQRGPHRDDILFLINQKDIRKYGSQGQQRTAALALKLSEIDVVKHKTNQRPILLLDDVLSELDRDRQMYLTKAINKIQTIMTCTGVEDYIRENTTHKLYEIAEGQVVR